MFPCHDCSWASLQLHRLGHRVHESTPWTLPSGKPRATSVANRRPVRRLRAAVRAEHPTNRIPSEVSWAAHRSALRASNLAATTIASLETLRPNGLEDRARLPTAPRRLVCGARPKRCAPGSGPLRSRMRSVAADPV